jgi:hypothetical protein
MSYSHKYSFELNNYITQIYNSEVICVVFMTREMQGKQKDTLFFHDLLFTNTMI